MADPCIPRKTPEEFYSAILTMYRSEVLKGRAVLDTDPMHAIAAVVAGAMYQSQTDFERRVRAAAFVSEMCFDDLVNFAESINSPLRGAQSARGYVVVTGTAGTTIPATITFTSTGADPQEYALDPLVTAATELSDNGDGTGSATLLVRATVPGAAGNLLVSGTSLTLTGAITGIDDTATLSGFITGGTDEETEEELRARLESQRANAATCGNQAWFDAKLKEFPGVSRVCVEDCTGGASCGGAFQTHYVFMDNVYEDGIPPSSVVDDITDWLYGVPQGEGRGEAMVGLMGQVLSPKAAVVNVLVTGLSNASPSARASMESAFEDYFKNQACVGARLCRSDLFGVVRSVLPTACFTSITLSGDDVTALNDGADFQIALGAFPKLGSLAVT